MKQNVVVGIIAKNEEAMLSKLLPLIKEDFPHILAIDYGSTDKTRIILDSFCDHVETMDWPNSFGEAKTNLIKMAEKDGYDWLFVLDADECMAEGTFFKIVDAINRNKYDVYYMPRINFIDRGIINGEISANPDLQARLFKLNIGYHYRNVVHCILYKGDDTQCAWELNYGAVLPYHIQHFKGLKTDKENRRSIAERYTMETGRKKNIKLVGSGRPVNCCL